MTKNAVQRLNHRGDPVSHAPTRRVEWCAQCGAFKHVDVTHDSGWYLPGEL